MASVQEASKKPEEESNKSIRFDGGTLRKFIKNGPYFAGELYKAYEDIKSEEGLAGEMRETFGKIKSEDLQTCPSIREVLDDDQRKLMRRFCLKAYIRNIPVEQLVDDLKCPLSLKECILKAMGKVNGDKGKGIPPPSDPSVSHTYCFFLFVMLSYATRLLFKSLSGCVIRLVKAWS